MRSTNELPPPKPDPSRWFPKPAECTCAYDVGWIYPSPTCTVHKGLTPP